MRRSTVLVCCAFLTGCLDYHAAYERCVAAGRCTDGGTAGSGGSSAGGGMGGGSGGEMGGGTGGSGGEGGEGGGGGSGGTGGSGGSGGGAPVYDGGAPCASSRRPRLQCDAPWVVANGGPYDRPALAPMSDGLIAAWTVGQRVDLVHLTFDGGVWPVLTENAPAAVETLSLAAEESTWALLYGTSTALRCFSSVADGGVSPGATGPTPSAAVAVTRDGGVAVVRGGPTLSRGISSFGCPTSLVGSTFGTDHVAAVHLPGTGTEGFRFTGAEGINASNGSISIVAPLSDGGFDYRAAGHNQVPLQHAAAVNAEGTHVVTAYIFTENFAASPVDYDLGLRSLPTNLATPAANLPFLDEPRGFGIAPCGDGCMATAFIPKGSPSHVSAFLSTDRQIMEARGAADAGWDVACAAPPLTTVAVAWHDGRLRFLVTEPAKASIYSCDVP